MWIISIVFSINEGKLGLWHSNVTMILTLNITFWSKFSFGTTHCREEISKWFGGGKYYKNIVLHDFYYAVFRNRKFVWLMNINFRLDKYSLRLLTKLFSFEFRLDSQRHTRIYIFLAREARYRNHLFFLSFQYQYSQNNVVLFKGRLREAIFKSADTAHLRASPK